MTTARSSFFRDMVRTSVLAAAFVSPAAFAGPKDVPFKVALTISESVAPSGNGCSLTGTIGGIGLASYLNNVSVSTSSAQDCIVLTNPGVTLDSNFSNNNLVLQAANGDFLYVTYYGTAKQQEALLVLTGKFKINGGTGRFAQAKGTGDLDGLEDISGVFFGMPAAGTVMLSGKISY